MADAYSGIEITKLFVFGTRFPDSIDYNDHIRSKSSSPASITYDMGWYMNEGGGRFAYPSLFGAVQKFFQQNIPNGKYTYSQMANLLGLTKGDRTKIISQYGLGIGSEDQAERSWIFGTTEFELSTSNMIFEVSLGQKRITGMEVRALPDNFDFKGGSNLGNALGAFVFKPTLDPYDLSRGEVAINYSGSGKKYLSYDSNKFELDRLVASDGFSTRELGIASLVANGGIQYFTNIANSPFLSYEKDGKKVVYGTSGDDVINSSSYIPRLGSVPISQLYIVGGTGNDTLAGGLLSDDLYGGIGDDHLYGSGGNDTLNGEIGNDTYYLYDTDDKVVEKKNEGTDIIKTYSEDIFNHFRQPINRKNVESVELVVNGVVTKVATDEKDNFFNVASFVTGSPTYKDFEGFSYGGNDTLTGFTGNDTLHGGKGFDYIYGGVGIDKLFGDAGDDFLYGEDGDDILRGGAGIDSLDGGVGRNKLFGGGDKDTFVLATGGVQIISDFEDGIDKIDGREIGRFNRLSLKQKGNDVNITGQNGELAAIVKDIRNGK